jgi:hypothetical protein
VQLPAFCSSPVCEFATTTGFAKFSDTLTFAVPGSYFVAAVISADGSTTPPAFANNSSLFVSLKNGSTTVKHNVISNCV